MELNGSVALVVGGANGAIESPHGHLKKANIAGALL